MRHFNLNYISRYEHTKLPLCFFESVLKLLSQTVFNAQHEHLAENQTFTKQNIILKILYQNKVQQAARKTLDKSTKLHTFQEAV